MENITRNYSCDDRVTDMIDKVDEIVKEQGIKYLASTNQIPSPHYPFPTFMNDIENIEDFESRRLAQNRILTQQESDKKSGFDKRTLFYYDVKLDMLNIMETAPQLGHLILNDHDCGRWMFQEIIREFLEKKFRKEFEVVIDINLTSWPTIDICNRIKSLSSDECGSHPITCTAPRVISGIMVAISRSTEFIRSSSYRCSDSNCSNSKVTHYRHVRFPGFETDSGLSFDSAKSGCQLCCSPISEEPSRRDIWEFLVGIILPFESLETSVGGRHCNSNYQNRRWQGVPIYFGKQWFSALTHGQRYEIIGQPLFSSITNPPAAKEYSGDESIPHPPYISGSGNVFECVGLKPSTHPLKRWAELLNNIGEFAVSEDIYTMYLKCIQSSPWSFVHSLAYEFGSKICPKDCFFKLKLAILLSLVSQTANEEDWPLPLMVIARDTNFPAKLMQYGMDLAGRSIIHSAEINDLIPSPSPCAVNCGLTSTSHKCGTLYTDAGSILLSRGGVCYLGELQLYKKQTLHLLKSILVEGRVQTNESRTQKKKCRFSSQCISTSLWCVCTLPDGKGVYNYEKQKTSFISNHKHLIDLFGQALLVENDNLNQMNKMEESLIDFILEDALNQDMNKACQDVCESNSNEPSLGIIPSESIITEGSKNIVETHLCFQELKEFLSQAKEIETEINSDALELIKKYFVASRRSRGSMDTSSIIAGSQNTSFNSIASTKGGNVPQSALKTITTMAESHAKLCLRRSVTVDDAVFAIYTYEENIQALYGNGCLDWSTSPLMVAHEPHLREGWSDTDLIECFKSAKLSIYRFIESFTGDLSFTQVEE